MLQVDPPSLLKVIFAFIKPFLKKKMLERVRFITPIKEQFRLWDLF